MGYKFQRFFIIFFKHIYSDTGSRSIGTAALIHSFVMLAQNDTVIIKDINHIVCNNTIRTIT